MPEDPTFEEIACEDLVVLSVQQISYTRAGRRPRRSRRSCASASAYGSLAGWRNRCPPPCRRLPRPEIPGRRRREFCPGARNWYARCRDTNRDRQSRGTSDCPRIPPAWAVSPPPNLPRARHLTIAAPCLPEKQGGSLDLYSDLAQKNSIWVGTISDKHNRVISAER